MVQTTVCISFDETTLFRHSGYKGGSDLAKSMVFPPNEGHFLNTDLITFPLKFMYS